MLRVVAEMTVSPVAVVAGGNWAAPDPANWVSGAPLPVNAATVSA